MTVSIPEQISEELSTMRGWMFDVDGCLMRTDRPGGQGGEPMPSAGALIAHLYETGHQVVVCTNASEQTPEYYAEHMRSVGVPVRDEDFMTAGSAAADYIAHHYPRGSILALGSDGLVGPLRDRGAHVASPKETSVDAVVIGDAQMYSYEMINAACAAVEAGAALYTTVLKPWFYGGLGKAVAISALITTAVGWATSGQEPQVLGKPSPALAKNIQTRLGMPADQICIVGDAPAEVELARHIRAHAALVLSGSVRPEDLPSLNEPAVPDTVAADVEVLYHHLKSHATTEQ